MIGVLENGDYLSWKKGRLRSRPYKCIEIFDGGFKKTETVSGNRHIYKKKKFKIQFFHMRNVARFLSMEIFKT